MIGECFDIDKLVANVTKTMRKINPTLIKPYIRSGLSYEKPECMSVLA